MTEPDTVLALTGVEKTFPGVRALKGVSLAVRAGEVQALVGENGAGKSTLMAVAAGALAPDSGTVEVCGHRLEQASPGRAQSLGLAVVYQHTSVLEDLSVAENLAFSVPRERRPGPRERVEWAKRRLVEVGAVIDPRVRVDTLGVADRQLLEIAKALALETKVLILDEPTEALTSRETRRLFAQIRRITSTGAAVVYISHRLAEVREIADRITVMRDGEMRGTFPAAEISDDDVLALIVGRAVDNVFPTKATLSDQAPTVLAAQLDGGRLHDVSLTVRRGEILGLAGVEGNGQREVIRALAGVNRAVRSMTVAGDAVTVTSPAQARAAGIAYIPRDRHGEGMFEGLSVRENASLLALPQFTRRGVVSRTKESAAVATLSQALEVKTPTIETDARSLSGGNQQKVVFSRALMCSPSVILADEPTRGVDVGARVELYDLLREAADRGTAVVVTSADALELQGLCDRVLVMSRGRVVQELTGDRLTEAGITGAAITAATAAMEVTRRSPDTRGGTARWLHGDYSPSAILLALIAILAIYTVSHNSLFVGERSMVNLLIMAAAVGVVALGQQTALLIGSLDLSVGPLMGLVVGLLSYLTPVGSGAGGITVGIVCCLALGVGTGLLNAGLIRLVRLPPVIATLVTYTCLGGIALLIRSKPGGSIDLGFTNGVERDLGTIPLAAIVVVVLAVVMEVVLRRSRAGSVLRAVGSDETRAHRLGAPVSRTFYGAHVVCSVCAVLGGFLLAAQVGIGQAPLGTEYTLTSITAVVLGGASLLGSRGSYLGSLLGALFVQEIVSATPFLNLGQEWQDWLPGALIIIGVGVYSRLRSSSRALSGAVA